MREFCTYFDKNYLIRGLALYNSLEKHCPDFRLWILCMDPLCFNYLRQLNLQNVVLIPLDHLENGDVELQKAKSNRSAVEYYFTCTSSILLYIFKRFPGVDSLTYIDSDFFLFSDPSVVFDEIGEHPIAITAHRFSPDFHYLERRYGLYNVGWLTFRRSTIALECLQRWRAQCLEWCYDRVEDERFGDQMYLNDWPRRYPETYIIQHKGVNLMPCNIGNYAIYIKNNQVYVDDAPLICYHFFGLKGYRGMIYYLSLSRYGVDPTPQVLKGIYEPYLKCMDQVQSLTLSKFIIVRETKTLRGRRRGSLLLRIHSRCARMIAVTKAIVRRQFFLSVRGHIIFKFIPCGIKTLFQE